jgi:hypothetical protein
MALQDNSLKDGLSTFITFSLDANVVLYEKEMNPPGKDMGEKIDTTSMRNGAVRTAWAKSLYTLTPITIQCSYDSDAYNSVGDRGSMLGVNQLMTATLPDSSTIDFWAFIKHFIPKPHKEGEQPMAEVVLEPTNYDDSFNETEPVFTAAP